MSGHRLRERLRAGRVVSTGGLRVLALASTDGRGSGRGRDWLEQLEHLLDVGVREQERLELGVSNAIRRRHTIARLLLALTVLNIVI